MRTRGTTRLFLIRHGETDWNRAGLLQGRADVPLNARGRAQAVRLADRLARVPLAAVYTSPLRRAYETGAAIARTQGARLVSVPELSEISYGLWQGKSNAWLRRHDPIFEHRWRTMPWSVRFPGGESLHEVRSRARAALRRIAPGRSRGAVAICAHGHVLRVLRIELLHLPRDRFWSLPQDNARVYVIRRASQREARGCNTGFR